MTKEYIVTEKAKRPASPVDECFYCHQPVGGYHDSECVLIQRKVTVRMTIEYDVSVPAKWGKEDIEFHRNESSWCSTNAIGELEEITKDGCLCDKTNFAYLREASGPYLGEGVMTDEDRIYREEERLRAELTALRARCADVDGLAEALFGNEMLYSDYDAESRTGPVPKLWKDVSEWDKGYFREIAVTVVAYLKEG